MRDTKVVEIKPSILQGRPDKSPIHYFQFTIVSLQRLKKALPLCYQTQYFARSSRQVTNTLFSVYNRFSVATKKRFSTFISSHAFRNRISTEHYKVVLISTNSLINLQTYNEKFSNFWKAFCCPPSNLTCPATPLPLTVSNVPARLNILQCLSRSCTVSCPRFSILIQ